MWGVHVKNAKIFPIITLIVIVITWAIFSYKTREPSGNPSIGLGSGPVTFPKIVRQPPPADYNRNGMTALPTDPLQMDLRSYDLSALDLSHSMSDLLYATYDDRTSQVEQTVIIIVAIGVERLCYLTTGMDKYCMCPSGRFFLTPFIRRDANGPL